MKLYYTDIKNTQVCACMCGCVTGGVTGGDAGDPRNPTPSVTSSQGSIRMALHRVVAFLALPPFARPRSPRRGAMATTLLAASPQGPCAEARSPRRGWKGRGGGGRGLYGRGWRLWWSRDRGSGVLRPGLHTPVPTAGGSRGTGRPGNAGSGGGGWRRQRDAAVRAEGEARQLDGGGDGTGQDPVRAQAGGRMSIRDPHGICGGAHAAHVSTAGNANPAAPAALNFDKYHRTGELVSFGTSPYF